MSVRFFKKREIAAGLYANGSGREEVVEERPWVAGGGRSGTLVRGALRWSRKVHGKKWERPELGGTGRPVGRGGRGRNRRQGQQLRAGCQQKCWMFEKREKKCTIVTQQLGEWMDQGSRVRSLGSTEGPFEVNGCEYKVSEIHEI